MRSYFYQGLISKSDTQNSENTVALFENALSDSNVYIRQAAAEELANMMYNGTELSARTVKRLRREAAGTWAAAFDAVGRTPSKEKALAFLLDFEQEIGVPNEARLYTLREFEKREVFFSETELAAINGHFAISRSRYNEALVFFRRFTQEGEWPERIPQLFLEYPVLINDLGRAFQYTASGNEGLNLFLRWEASLAEAMTANISAVPEDSDALRYRLLFFAARIARRRGMNEQAFSLFQQSLVLAPTTEQSDACVWYILDLSVRGESGVFLERLEQLLPYLHRGSSIYDILERFLQTLVSRQDWENIIGTFALIKHRADSLAAGYAWVIARAVQEGYLSEKETLMAAQTANVPSPALTPDVFKRIAYNTANRNNTTAYFYRRLSATALREPFLELPSVPAAISSSNLSPALEFILGFFDNGVSDLSLQYIRALERELSPDELRTVAQALEKAGMYAQSIRHVSRYITREDHSRTRQDMELFFPRPYRELVEKYAKEYGFSPALLFGLIRTESAFQNTVISHAGAVGLTQLMPATAQEMVGRLRRSGGPDYATSEGELDLDDPDVNIHIGVFYLNYLNVRFDDTLVSLLAYNGGMNRVRRWLAVNTMPTDLFMETVPIYETRDYGRKVMGAAAVYEELYYR